MQSSGGPPLISDHQMAIDSEAQMIYVSGGRVIDAEWDSLKFSGLYSYDIRTSRWKMYKFVAPILYAFTRRANLSLQHVGRICVPPIHPSTLG